MLRIHTIHTYLHLYIHKGRVMKQKFPFWLNQPFKWRQAWKIIMRCCNRHLQYKYIWISNPHETLLDQSLVNSLMTIQGCIKTSRLILLYISSESDFKKRVLQNYVLKIMILKTLYAWNANCEKQHSIIQVRSQHLQWVYPKHNS